MDQTLFTLRGAKQSARAACDGLVFDPLNGRATDWTCARHDKRHRENWALSQDRAHDFGDDIPCSAHNHRITYTYIFAQDFSLVMQGRVGHRHAAYKNGG